MTRALTVEQVLALPALVTVAETAAALGGLGVSSVYRAAGAGTLPVEPLRLGSRLLFRRADILSLLGVAEEARTAQPGESAPQGWSLTVVPAAS